jgi:hypothetical protein
LKTYRLILIFACSAIAMGLAPALRAQSLPEQMRACRAETDDARRLNCYDRAAATLDKAAASAPTAATATVPARPAVAPAAPVASSSAAAAPAGPPAASAPAGSGVADFGVSEGPLAVKRQATGLKEITAVVTAVSARGRGELVLTLDNGQVWAQNEAVEYFPVNVGDKVKIHSAALGSYLLTTPAKRTTKVTRLR